MTTPEGTAQFDLTGLTALVTGSSQGIGLAIARALASAGAAIVLNGRDETKLGGAANDLREAGYTVDILAFDVTDHAAAAAAIDGFENGGKQIDVLFNNAGMQHRGPLEDFDPAMFERLMLTNVNSIFNVGQAAARHMIPRGRGKVINIASIQSVLARPGIAPYTASKGAVANLTKGMATDWGPKGLQVNAIAPGYFKTPLNKALTEDAEFTAWVEKRTPLGRWGDLPELGGISIFLASPASSFVNGQTIFVDGGMSVCL